MLFFAALGTFVFWLLKKDDENDIKIFYISRHFLNSNNSFLEVIDILISSAICGIITVKLLEPTLDKQAIASGLTVVHTLNYIIKKSK